MSSTAEPQMEGEVHAQEEGGIVGILGAGAPSPMGTVWWLSEPWAGSSRGTWAGTPSFQMPSSWGVMHGQTRVTRHGWHVPGTEIT